MNNRSRDPGHPSGMTLLEIVISAALFGALMLVAYSALMSARMATNTGTTQIELQESGRRALEFMCVRLRNSGRFGVDAGGNVVPTYTAGARMYPCVYKSGYYPVPHLNFPTGQGYCDWLSPGYNTCSNQPNINCPKAPAGVLVGGGDPTLDSNDIIFRAPDGISPDDPPANGVARASVAAGYLNYPMDKDATTLKLKIRWSPVDYGFFVVPAPDGTNQLEYRNSTDCTNLHDALKPVQGTVVCRYVDRLEIHDTTNDATLTDRQIRIVLYLTRVIPGKGALTATSTDKERISISISCTVDMRNTNYFD